MTRWKLKSCPRCGGDILIDQDHHGWYEACLQCGYSSELQNLTEFKQPTPKREGELVRAQVSAGKR